MDQYSYLHGIGKGSYGEVFLVKGVTDSTQYVLKRIKLDSLSEKEKRAATQESRLLSELTHPNIVSYKDSFHHNGLLHIVMSYCEGGDLNRYLKARNSCHLSESKIIHWFIQIALALQYLHRQHILHRDLKTQNVFLSRNIIKLGDLGIARVLESSSAMARTFIGTPYYMSPEIFRNMPYNHKSDIWALGCCVVEMATLKTAFSARDMNSLAFKIIVGKLPSIPSNYSVHLNQMIKCLLARDPDQRPSIDQLLKLRFIRNHIKFFLIERRKCRSSEPLTNNSATTPTTQQKSIQLDSMDDATPLNQTSDEVQNSYAKSTLSETIVRRNDEDTLTTVSSYMDTTSTLRDGQTSTNSSPNNEILSSNSDLNNSQPDRLLKNISITQIHESEKDLKGNDIIEPSHGPGSLKENVMNECDQSDSKLKESVRSNQSEIELTSPPYAPQFINLSEFNSPPPNFNGAGNEVVDSEARQRRREQKRQQNYSNTLINRYLRKTSSNSPDKSQESSPSQSVDDNTTAETEVNSEPMEAKPCLKLCNEMPDLIDSDEERMLTLLSSTLKVLDDVPMQVNTLHKEWISRVRADSFDDLSLSECKELTEEDMQSNIRLIEDQCKQGLGERLFLRAQILVDKYMDSLEDLELNLKLILGQEKYPIYVALLLKLKFYKQLYSINFSSEK